MKLLEVYLLPSDQQRFKALATHSPAGDGEADSSLPFWEGEQDRRSTLIKVLEGTGIFNSAHFPRPGEQEWMVKAGLLTADQQSFHLHYLEHVGQALYNALFPPTSSLNSVLQAALRLTEQEETELHLRLKFSADSAKRSRLADYPWELLHDGQRFLHLHRPMFISRYIAYEALPPVVTNQAQLRVLLISPRTEDDGHGIAKLSDVEQLAIRTGLSKAKAKGLIELETLPKPTLKALSADLSQRSETLMPQVLHFDGHGLFGKRCVNLQCGRIHAGIKGEYCQTCGQALSEPTGFLLFEDEQGGVDYVSSASFAAFLPKGVALVVLSACQSGMAVAGESVFNGAAQQLIDARVPAVVAMQYAVGVDAASQFAEQFYRILGQKKPLVIALREGRKWMGVNGNQWYRPVLYLRWLADEGGNLFITIQGEGLEKFTEVQIPEVQKPMQTEGSLNSREVFYTKQIAQLEGRLSAVTMDLESSAREEERMGLTKRAEVILSQIEDLKTKLSSL